MVDEDGRETTYTYDARGRVASTTTEAGTTTITRTDLGAQGRREVITRPNGTSLRYLYNLGGKLVEVADSLSNRIVYTYDSEGNRTSELTYDPSGELARSIQYQYDQMNRLWKVLYPDGSDYEAYGYDPAGNRTSYRNASGRTTTYLYDSLNRLKEVT
jgi:YD repeat-containing protein